MAKGGTPQCEDGFTRIANELLEAMLRTDLTGREWKVILAVARKTYGFNKKADFLSHGQMAKLTGIERTHVCKICHRLEKRHILTVAAEGHTPQNKIAIQKDYSKWIDVATRGHGVAKIADPVAVEGHRGVAVEGTHKRKNLKTLTKETDLSQIEDLLSMFPQKDLPLIQDFFELLASENKTGKVTTGRKLGVTNQLFQAFSATEPDLFRIGLEEAVKHQAPNVNYIKAVIRNTAKKKDVQLCIKADQDKVAADEARLRSQKDIERTNEMLRKQEEQRKAAGWAV